jgi:uncharacterized BrkB/YihY/UPF0761 family membrane protein
MSATTVSASGKVWEAIDNEKRRDRFIKKVSIISWTITFLLVVALGAILVSQMIFVAKALAGAGAGWQPVLPLVMRLVISLGILSVLIATLSTIAIFLRLRTSSLNEIQLRLAALEDMIVARTDNAK